MEKKAGRSRHRKSAWRIAYDVLITALLHKTVGVFREGLQIRTANGQVALDAYWSKNTPSMQWLYAANPRTLATFGQLASAFEEDLSAFCGTDVILAAASFITVRGGVGEDQSFLHVDYGPPGIPPNTAFSVLTPLYNYPEQVGGLEYVEAEEANTSLDSLSQKERKVVKYREGEAQVLHAKLLHRTEPFPPPCPPRDRVLVCLQFATTEVEHWENGIESVFEMQTPRFYARPEGLGRKWGLEARRGLATFVLQRLLGKRTVAY